MQNGSQNENPIEEAKAYAREAILETYPNLRETEEPIESSYEYDGIMIRDEECDVYEIGIMHHEESETFALVEKTRTAMRLAEEAEHELAIADLLRDVEVKVMMLLQNCRTNEEVGAAWGAISASFIGILAHPHQGAGRQRGRSHAEGRPFPAHQPAVARKRNSN